MKRKTTKATVRKLSKAKQIFLYVASFPALILFQVWVRPDRTPESLLIMASSLLAYCALIILISYRWDKPGYFDWAMAGYFMAISAALLLWPEDASEYLRHYAATGIYVSLFTAAFLPPLLGMDPFTFHYAKKSAPPEAWNNPIFIRVNRIMTFVWAGIFAVGVFLSLHPSLFLRTILPNGLILCVGFPFNSRFPDYYLKRLGLPSRAEQGLRVGKERGPVPPSPPAGSLPTSAREAISKMPDALNAEAARGLSAIIGFIVSGSETFEAYLNICDGVCTLREKPSRKPDLIIRTPAEIWLAISRGESSGQEAFMRNAYTADGDLGLLMGLKRIFSPAPSAKTIQTLSKEDQPVQVKQTIEVEHQPIISGKEKVMKVLALNSSPRGEGQSKTELMLKHLVAGMLEAGAEVEVVRLRNKKVKDCIGCFTCWTKTPGLCIHKDDMTKELFPKWLQSDLVVYATPLYHFTVNAVMKAFIERTLPVVQPFFVESEGSTKHPLRAKHPAVVMLSVAGLPEDSVFDQLSSWTNFVFRKSLVAQIYRAGAEIMISQPALAEKVAEILEATKQAGREVVRSMKVSPETMTRINQPISQDKSMLNKMGNLFWKTCIAEGVTPKEFAEKGLVPRPDSIETFMLIMPMGFNPQRAGDTKAVIEFKFSGDVEGSCQLKIENGKIEARPGTAESPSLTIETPFNVWMDILTGKADGPKMFMEQKYRVHGDLSLLMRMNQLFGK
jgi:putative sterol carrier protein/FMN-dependent NADH-azoreductase